MMELIDIILHLDKHIAEWIVFFGPWLYVILFLIIFAETGLVVTPFLPGDSLLFAAGTFAALGSFDIGLLLLTLAVAAVLGDTVNYWIGHRIGERAFSGRVRFLREEHLRRTQAFYERHGGKTIVLARFIPIIRTFAPFVAGVGRMHYPRFLAYNIAGGVAWVALFTLAGYFFGNIAVVKQNFSLVIMVIILLSVVPIAVEFFRSRRREPV